jgi:glycerophosphoryl diester phosphodiesterase
MRPPRIVAHRGASEDAPEHTRFAYEAALAQAADSIEVDLQLTADAVLVCLHDETLERVAGDPRPVREVTSEELLTLDVGSWFNRMYPDRARPEFVGASPVLFTEHLAWLRDVAPQVGVHVEMKQPETHDGRMVDEVVAALVEHGRAGADVGPVVVETFDEPALRQVGERVPGVQLGVLWIEARAAFVAADFDVDAAVSGPSIWSLFMAPEHVDNAHERGIEVHVWTANDEEEIEALMDLGVDAIVTDRPAAVREMLAGGA